MTSPDRPPGSFYIIAAVALAIVVAIVATAPLRDRVDAPTAVAGRSGEPR
jgi:hypothetical protein